MIERHAPIVDLEHPDLHQPEQAALVLDIEIFLLALAAGDGDLLDRLAHALHGVALEEAFFGVALRTAHEADRAVHRVRQHEGGNGLVIAGEVELGEADIGIEHPVGIGERDPAEGRIAGFLGGGSSGRGHRGLLIVSALAMHLARLLVLT